MELLHSLKLDENHLLLVFQTESKSNYNRFVSVVHKDKRKEFLHGTTMKTEKKSIYKEKGFKLLKSFLSMKENILDLV